MRTPRSSVRQPTPDPHPDARRNPVAGQTFGRTSGAGLRARRTRSGEYRPVFEKLYDGTDFQRLNGIARSVLVALKVKLPGWGIGVLPALAALAEWWTGFPATDCATALETLEAEGWIRRDGAVLWLVRGLEFEPSRVPADRKHRKSLADHLASLPSVPLLAEFRAHYAEWFEAPAEATTSSIEGAPQAHRSPTEGAAQGHASPTAGATQTQRTPPSPSTSTNPTTPTPSAGRDFAPPDNWPQLHNHLPSTGLYRQAVAEFLATVPEAQAGAWVSRLLQLLGGMDAPGGRPVSPDLLVAALTEYASVRTEAEPPQPHKLALFDGCLRRLATRRAGDAAAARASPATGAPAMTPAPAKRLRRLTELAEASPSTERPT